MKIWKVILAAAVIYAAGIVTGGLAVKFNSSSSAPPPKSSPPSFGRQRGDLAERMQHELGLNGDQRTRIEEILRSSHERTKQLWDSIAPQANEEHRRVREQIRALLTPEQMEKYEQIFKPRSRGHSKSGEPKKREGDEEIPRGSSGGNPASPQTPAKTSE